MLTAQSILLITTEPLKRLQAYLGFTFPTTNPDIYIVESEKSISIDQIREVQQFARKQPFGPEKYIVMPQFDSATLEAQNALLKLLEEPPSYLRIVLTARNQFNLLETIVSRCFVVGDEYANEEVPENASTLLQQLFQATPSARLSLLPTTKTKAEALIWCNALLLAARSAYSKNPTLELLVSVKVLHECWEALNHNANPTMALTDAVLRLK